MLQFDGVYTYTVMCTVLIYAVSVSYVMLLFDEVLYFYCKLCNVGVLYL